MTTPRYLRVNTFVVEHDSKNTSGAWFEECDDYEDSCIDLHHADPNLHIFVTNDTHWWLVEPMYAYRWETNGHGTDEGSLERIIQRVKK